jgi:hypothetical protein
MTQKMVECIIGNEGWESTQLVWNFGLITSCDVGFPENPRRYFEDEAPIFEPERYESIKSGDIIWVQPHQMSAFYEMVFPRIQVPFVLVISDGDASFPSDSLKPNQFEGLLASEYLVHIFAQNCDYQGRSKKISPIPIGIDFHTVAYSYKSATRGWGMIGSPKQQEANLLKQLQEAPPTSQRKLRAFVDFQHTDSIMKSSFMRGLQFGEDRTSIFIKLAIAGVVDYDQWMKRGDLWKTKRNYAFSISPHGNGLDCHRTWEDLALGCIVIVKSSPLDPMYEGLPVVIIQDWKEITEENYQKWIIEYGIDFIYLDSYDYELNNPIGSQLHHLKEIEAAHPFLRESSVIMIDDCDLPEGGKGKFAIEFLLERGWRVVKKQYQVILAR